MTCRKAAASRKYRLAREARERSDRALAELAAEPVKWKDSGGRRRSS
jgi:hypothetical protein